MDSPRTFAGAVLCLAHVEQKSLGGAFWFVPTCSYVQWVHNSYPVI